MSLITQKPNYNIAHGDKDFDSVQIDSNKALIQVAYDGVIAGDVIVELYQSPDGENYDYVDGTRVKLLPLDTSMSWNLNGIIPGTFWFVRILTGAADAGTINKITYLQ